MKKKLFKLCLILFSFLLIFQNVFALDVNYSKEEVVYGKMNEDGSIESLFIVNAFDVKKDKVNIVDYGQYKEVINTTNNQQIQFDGIKSNIKDVEKGRFFYQGELTGSTQLPWLIDMSYYLDNALVASHDVAGKSGKLKIEIDSKQNKNVNPIYFENYLLTITINLDSKKVKNLKAEEATIANAGDQKTIVFTGLPKKEAHYVLEMDIEDFEMEAIQFAALPFSMAIELPDISQFTDGISDLQSGIKSINFGAGQLAQGISILNSKGSSLKSGANQLLSGAKQLKSGVSQSASGSEKFVSGLSEYTGGVNQLSLGSKELVTGSKQIKDGINLLASSLNKQAGSLKLTPNQKAMVDGSIAALRNLKTFLKDDLGAAVFLPVAQALKRETVLKVYPDLDLSNPQIVQLLNYMEVQAQAIEKSYNLLNPVHSSIKNNFLPKIDEMIKMLQGITQFGQLIDGVNQLNNQYGNFHNGLIQLSNGLSKLEESSGQLVSGGNQLKDGLKKLDQGVSDFASGVNQYSRGINQYTSGVSELSSGANKLSSGTSQLHNATKGIDTLMQEKIEELMKDYEFEEFEMQSFVDEKNENVDLVQFVFMTQPITKPPISQEVMQEEPEKSIWDLVLDLFR